MPKTSHKAFLPALALMTLASSSLGAPRNASSGSGDVTNRGAFERCGTPNPSAAEMKQCRRVLESNRWRVEPGAAAPIEIAVHVITCGGRNDVSDAAIAAQVAELNRAFAPAELRFELASVERVDNCTWRVMTPGSAEEQQAKHALAVDPTRRLNLYITDPGSTLLGWAYLPMDAGPTDLSDGVVVNYRTLPGSRFQPFDLGRTAVHEVGHYLGLYHTFQDGCGGSGDEVDDTPAEAWPAAGCPVGRNTCPSLGDDPIHDYMDYSDDACTWEFTPGQIDRMRQVIAGYRSDLVGWPGAGYFAEGGRERTVRKAAAPLARTVSAQSSPGVELEGAVPNPACEKGVIRFTLPSRTSFTLRLRDADGRLLRVLSRGRLDAGAHEVDWTSGSLPNGVYTIELASRGAAYRRLVLVEHGGDRAPGAGL